MSLATTFWRDRQQLLVRLALVLCFTALTALGARIRLDLPFTPVPITLQVLAVLLSGLVLGAREGAASQLAYVLAITAGAPLDAGGLGTAVWLRPSAGYLLGFIGGAWLTGYLAHPERLPNSRLPSVQGQGVMRRFVAGLAGVAVIYFIGAAWLTYGFLNGDWTKGVAQGIAPFVAVDACKAFIAATIAEGGTTLVARLYNK